jgi:Asp-tRNA(Asn)/Glu-tRNA(Gln) amidotransferase B subunit
MSIPDGWEVVIGLEVHTELLTETKMFSSAPNHSVASPTPTSTPSRSGSRAACPCSTARPSSSRSEPAWR